jgi:hypothetical protein
VFTLRDEIDRVSERFLSDLIVTEGRTILARGDHPATGLATVGIAGSADGGGIAGSAEGGVVGLPEEAADGRVGQLAGISGPTLHHWLRTVSIR